MNRVHKLVLITAFAVVGSGTLTAAIVPCPSGMTAAFYQANFTSQANGCLVGGAVEFWGFTYTNTAGPSAVALPASDMLVTPIADVNGFGFDLTPTIPWTASPTGRSDSDLLYIAQATTGNTLDDIYFAITGTATGTGGSDVLTEAYCAGSSVKHPTAPCVGGSPVIVKVFTIAGSASTTTVSGTDLYGLTSVISVDKDMDVRGISQDGNSTGSAQILSVSNRISITTPEPTSAVLWGTGLIGLGALLSLKKRLQ